MPLVSFSTGRLPSSVPNREKEITPQLLAGFFFLGYNFPMTESKEERLKQLKAKQAKLAQEIKDLDDTAPPQPAAPLSQDKLDERENDFKLNNDTRYVTFQPYNQLMKAGQDPREIDMRPQRVFFYRRLTDDVELMFTEAEAARMMESTHAPILRQLGVSDGSTYANYLKNCGVKVGERIPQERAQKILNDAWAAEKAAALGHYAEPMSNSVHFDSTIRNHKNARSIIQGFGA